MCEAQSIISEQWSLSMVSEICEIFKIHNCVKFLEIKKLAARRPFLIIQCLFTIGFYEITYT